VHLTRRTPAARFAQRHTGVRQRRSIDDQSGEFPLGPLAMRSMIAPS